MQATKLKYNYDFNQKDQERVKRVGQKLSENAEAFVQAFYNYVSAMPEARRYLDKEEVIERHKAEIYQWYLSLFEGPYDNTYFARLHRIGETHVRIGLPTHYVNASVNFVQRYINEQIEHHFAGDAELVSLIAACGKVLDMNLDILTSAYHEGQMAPFERVSRYKIGLIRWAQKASDMTDLVLVIALMLVGPFVIGLFVYDVYLLVTGKVGMEEGILMVLGSLLILWALSELMEEEVRHLRGEGFAIAAFLSLAMAALIRKILVASLAEDKMYELLSYGALVLALGLVYWLIVKNDIRIGKRPNNRRSHE